MTKSIYRIKLTTFSFTVLFIVIFLAFQSTFSKTNGAKNAAFEGFWKQIGYGRVIEVNGNDVKIYDVSKVSCVLSDEEKLSNIGNVKEISNEKAIVKNGINDLEFIRIKALPKLCSQNKDKENDPLFNFDSLWHTFNEHYAYFKTRNIDWDTYYKKYRSRLTSKSSDVELYGVIKEMLDSLNDGHVNFKAPSKISKEYAEKNKTTKKKEMSDIERILASQKLNEEIAKKYVKNVKTYNSGVLRWGMVKDDVAYLQINFMFLMSKQKSIPENAPFIQFVQKYFELREKGEINESAESVGAKDAMKMILNDIKNAKSLIIDIRFNPGGTDEVPLTFLSHFTDSRKKVFTKKARLGNDFTRPQEIYVNPAKPFFKSDVYLLTSHQSASAAEIMSISTNVFPNIKRIGSNTEGIFSDILGKKLPNGWDYSLSNEVYLDTEGVDYESKGIPPHHKIEYSKEPKKFFEFMENEIEKGDQAIEAALKLVRKSEKPDSNNKADKHQQLDLSGKWILSADTQGQNANITFEITQTGAAFTGTVFTSYGNGLITNGKITGNKFGAVVNLNAAGMNLQWNLKGNVENRIMSGVMEGNGAPTVEIRGKKKKYTNAKYSGLWMPDINKSNLPENLKAQLIPKEVVLTEKLLSVKPRNDLLKEPQKRTNEIPGVSASYECKLDGIKTTTKINAEKETGDGIKYKVVGTSSLDCELSSEGNLIVNREIALTTHMGNNSSDEAISKASQTWKLSANGETLSIKTDLENLRGEKSHTVVYKRISDKKSVEIPDYSGIWRLDMEKSKLSERSRLKAATMLVKQTPFDITIKKNTELKDGNSNSVSFSTKSKDGEKCRFDGTKVIRELKNDIATGSITTTCGIKDGNLEIVKTSLIFVQGQAVSPTLKENWKLSSDRNTLTLILESKTGSRTRKEKMVLLRQ